MAGGLRTEFHQVYAADADASKFLCELHDRRCRMFFDVDLLARRALDGDWLLWLCARLQEVLRNGGFAAAEDCRVVATAADAEAVTAAAVTAAAVTDVSSSEAGGAAGIIKSGVHLHAPGVRYIRYGVHLHAPGVLVTTAGALEVRAALVAKLTAAGDAAGIGCDGEEVTDVTDVTDVTATLRGSVTMVRTC